MVIVAGIVAAILLGVWLVRRNGETAGAAKVTQAVEHQRAERIVEARADERAAAVVTDSISRRIARADDLSTQAVKATIKDLRDAIDTIPPAAAGAPPAAAPVDSLRDTLNAGIARANRAAGAAAPPD